MDTSVHNDDMKLRVIFQWKMSAKSFNENSGVEHLKIER